MTQLQSNAAALGIKLNLEPKPFNQVTALAAGNCVVAKIPCNWDLANWGGGWIVRPRLPAHRRDAVHVRRDRQLRRVLQHDQRLASSTRR